MKKETIRRIEAIERATDSGNELSRMTDEEFYASYAKMIEEARAAGDMETVRLATGPEEDLMAYIEAHKNGGRA